MRHTRKNGLIMTLIAIFAIMAMGTTAVAAGIGGTNTDLPFFAQNGNGNGNGGNSGENPPHRPGTGNSGQGQGAEHGNPPADPGADNNRQGGGQGEDEGDDEIAVPAETEDTGDEATDETVETEAEDGDTGEEQANPASEKLEICHVTGKDTGEGVLISISSRALLAHLRHGDEVVGADAEATCGDTAEAENAALAPDASPAAGETDADDAMEAGTPVASPMASPETGD